VIIIPVGATLINGGTTSFTISVTTSTNTTTGQFAEQTYAAGDQLQVMGCDAAQETFAELVAPVAGAPPAPECPSGFFDPAVINGNTAYVRTYDGTSQISVLVGAYTS
jgi:hypothetical protein